MMETNEGSWVKQPPLQQATTFHCEESKMPGKFVSGALYYRCGFGIPESPLVSTWVYLGYEHTPGKSSHSCDQAEHFYAFEEYEHWQSRQHRKDAKPSALHIPSLKQAESSFLTWDEFRKELEENQT